MLNYGRRGYLLIHFYLESRIGLFFAENHKPQKRTAQLYRKW